MQKHRHESTISKRCQVGRHWAILARVIALVRERVRALARAVVVTVQLWSQQ